MANADPRAAASSARGPRVGLVSAGRFPVALACIAVAALLVRVAFVLIVDPQVPRVGDASAYHLLANNLADGHGYIRPFDFAVLGRTRPTAEYPPLFPALVSLVSFAGGQSVEAQRLAMTVVGTVTVVVVGLLGRQVGGPAVGLVAGGLAAVYPMFFLSDGVLMAETPYVLLVALAVLLAYRAAEQPDLLRFGLLGFVIGASALTRAEGLLLAPLLVIPLAVRVQAEPRRRLVLAGVGVGVAVLAIVPWTVRNAVRLDAFVPVSNNIGTAVDGANCDLVYRGDQLGLWRATFGTEGGDDRTRPQAQACFEGFDIERARFDEAEVAATHRRDGVDYARDHLGRVPVVVTARWLRTWGLYNPTQQIEFESLEGRPERWQRFGTQMYWVLLPLAVAGGLILARSRRARLWPLLATVVLVSLTTVVTYGQQRFRIAAEPAIVVLGAVAIVSLVRRMRRASGVVPAA